MEIVKRKTILLEEDCPNIGNQVCFKDCNLLYPLMEKIYYLDVIMLIVKKKRMTTRKIRTMIQP